MLLPLLSVLSATLAFIFCEFTLSRQAVGSAWQSIGLSPLEPLLNAVMFSHRLAGDIPGFIPKLVLVLV
jgi:hypothetical protein